MVLLYSTWTTSSAYIPPLQKFNLNYLQFPAGDFSLRLDKAWELEGYEPENVLKCLDSHLFFSPRVVWYSIKHQRLARSALGSKGGTPGLEARRSARLWAQERATFSPPATKRRNWHQNQLQGPGRAWRLTLLLLAAPQPGARVCFGRRHCSCISSATVERQQTPDPRQLALTQIFLSFGTSLPRSCLSVSVDGHSLGCKAAVTGAPLEGIGGHCTPLPPDSSLGCGLSLPAPSRLPGPLLQDFGSARLSRGRQAGAAREWGCCQCDAPSAWGWKGQS